MTQNIDLTDIQFLSGSGVPSMVAKQGSIYVNNTASTSTTRLYVNTTGSSTWASFTASA